MKTFSLQEYRMSYPHTAAFPTLSQNRDLAEVLGRLTRKRQARERRAAVVMKMRAAAVEWIRWLWSEATHTRTPAPRYAAAPRSIPMPSHAAFRRGGPGMIRHVAGHAHA